MQSTSQSNQVMVKPFHGKITNGLTYCSFVICTFLVSGVAYFAFCFVCTFLYAFCMPSSCYIFCFFPFFSSCLFFFCIYTFFTISFFRSICLCVCLFLSLNALTLFLVIIFRLVSSFIDVAFVKSFKFPFLLV